jgi:type IV pilus assembly protein PilW
MNISLSHRRQYGMTLVELMIALLIGAVIIFGATTVYERSSKTYGVSESVARLQETARFAMSVIEPDVRMSGYFGLIKGASVLSWNGGALPGQGDPAAVGPPATCGRNFAIDLNTSLQGDNNAYVISTNAKTIACESLPSLSILGSNWATQPQATADTLTVRRASMFQSAATVAVLQVCSSRVAGRVFLDASVCGVAPARQINNVIVNTYYVDRFSQQSNTLPSLHRKMLTTLGGAVAFGDQEVIAGVEDLQVQFGIDPNGLTGVATRYVNPNLLPVGQQVASVRIWLLVRSDTGETGYTDNQIYQYGDRLQATGVTGDLNNAAAAGFAYQPSLSTDDTLTGPRHVRRLLITRTIQIRNALGT